LVPQFHAWIEGRFSFFVWQVRFLHLIFSHCF
jgi:hypothetical protein